jgi:hypothetical protein
MAKKKAIVKLGGAHTAYGIGPNNVPTLGSHISDYVKENKKALLSIGIFNHSDKNFPLPDTVQNKGIGTLIDCQKLIATLDTAYMNNLPESFRANLSYFDAVVYLYDAPKAGKDIILPLENVFKKKTIITLLLGGILMIAGLIGLLIGLNCLLKKKCVIQNTSLKYLLIYMTLLLVTCWAQVNSILTSFPFRQALLNNLMSSNSLFAIAGLILLVLIIMMFLQFQKRKITPGGKAYMIWMSLNTGILLLYAYYWNIGGMLG